MKNVVRIGRSVFAFSGLVGLVILTACSPSYSQTDDFVPDNVSLKSSSFPDRGKSLETKKISFRPKQLTVDANEGVAIADIDGDQRLDVVAGRNWYPAPEFAPRPLRQIDDWNGYVESNGDFVHDVNQDGRMDVIAGSFLPTQVFWYENPGGEKLKLGQLWSKHLLVDTKISQNEGSFLIDLDEDGVPEWATNSWNASNPVTIWKFSKDTNGTPSLTGHLIGDQGQAHGMGFGDVNNDGREDILFSNGWYERPKDQVWAKRWVHHADWNMGQTSPIQVRDLDGDGINDLVFGMGHDFGLFWWQGTQEKSEDGKLVFIKHKIDDRFSQAHDVHFADLDNDGVDELITGKRVRAHNGGDPGGDGVPCLYYYTWEPESKSFRKHVIDEGHVGIGLQIRTADLNEDGRLDIVVAGKDGTWILFQKEN